MHQSTALALITTVGDILFALCVCTQATATNLARIRAHTMLLRCSDSQWQGGH